MSAHMACGKCGHRGSSAMATVEHPTYNWIKRRRCCKACGHRWWTIELSQDELEITEDE